VQKKKKKEKFLFIFFFCLRDFGPRLLRGGGKSQKGGGLSLFRFFFLSGGLSLFLSFHFFLSSLLFLPFSSFFFFCIQTRHLFARSCLHQVPPCICPVKKP